MPLKPDEKYWEPLVHNGKTLYRCRVCLSGRLTELKKVKRHEETQTHRSFLPAFEAAQQPAPAPILDTLALDGLVHLLTSLTGNTNQPPYPSGHPLISGSTHPSPQTRSASPLTGFDWNLDDMQENTTADLSYEEQLAQDIAQRTLDFLNGDISEEEEENPYGLESGSDNDTDDADIFQSPEVNSDQPRKRPRGNASDPASARAWYPWQDRITCSLDILMHLPRSVFSRKQLDLFLWLLRINQVPDVPSIKTMHTLNKALQNMVGIDTIEYSGKMGHRYHVNNIGQILAQEMSNPRVRSNLHFYPEDAGDHLSEARQGQRWLNQLVPEETTPMIRLGSDDFYIYEPTLLTNGTFCIPFRWFTRVPFPNSKPVFYCRAWHLETAVHEGNRGWIVHQEREIEVSENQLLMNFPQLSENFEKYSVPHPSQILGVQVGPHDPGLKSWKHSNPVLGNRWRSLAKGHRTLALPLWLYCDDTSGNTSKKWNAHNSFLFTLAGLPSEHAAKEYNIHFACTSNIAPPLEMMDGVVEQLESAQKDGIWAWDCLYKEPVLIFPSVLALLGDNPMHSEFACHIGLAGKYFCRCCWVKGSDAQDAHNQSGYSGTGDNNTSGPDHYGHDNNASRPLSPTQSNKSSADGTTGRKPRFRETMQAMVSRITAFVKPGRPRTKEETKKTLAGYFERACLVGNKTRLQTERTESGIKDKMQEFFLDKLFATYQHKRGYQEKQRALDAAVAQLPDDITSPVWRLNGLDPHQDTPVEILHVVLLGFVKYFWRDLIQNRISDAQKPLLITRLNCLDVSGLGISKLSGHTLVKYAGSLTGRDFRAIAQVAPMVIQDLVPPTVFDAWVALSTLIPLIWQPIIENVAHHCTLLDKEIHNFLMRTARWSTAWFNKSKFHIIIHLPEHIRRFGPAMLFATESFESFNAVIRAKSIHSNRLAPSRDIALAFAQGNRIRHLFSGGYFLPQTDDYSDESHMSMVLNRTDWRTIGPSAMAILGDDPIPLSYLGLLDNLTISAGQCVHDDLPARTLSATLTGQRLPHAFPHEGRPRIYITSRSVHLQNADICTIGQYVIVRRLDRTFYLGCVREIIQERNSTEYAMGMANGVLVQTCRTVQSESSLMMPQVELVDEWCLRPLRDVMCTVNVQHNCFRQGCQATGSRYVYQERVQTNITTAAIKHIGNPHDLILNTAQMRDAIYVQQFRIPSVPLNEHNTIQESVAQVINLRKSNAAKTPGQPQGGQRAISPSISLPPLPTGSHSAMQNIPSPQVTGGRNSRRPTSSNFAFPGQGILNFSV